MTIEEKAPRISVIVPCYNIAGYVPACLESLAAQTYDSFEVICIDDGSNDETGQILDARAASDSRFKVLHQEHQGPSAARNAGVAAAVAPLVSFVDGDDVVSPYYLEVLATLQEQEDADIASCAHTTVELGEPLPFDLSEDVVEGAVDKRYIFAAQEALERIALDKIGLAFWAKLFKRELIDSHPFPEGIVFEDLWVLGDVVADAKVITRTPCKLYGYVRRPNSITRLNPTPLRHFFQFREAIEQFENAYAQCLGLEHATDNTSYCCHLVHRLCGLYTTLQRASCTPEEKRVYLEPLLEELKAAVKLARQRGVAATHPQMIRAYLLLRAPGIHDVLMSTYRRLSGL